MTDETFIKINEYVNGINFSPIIKKLVLLEGWIEKDAIETCEQYKKYICLKVKYGNQYKLPPSKDIDFFWHEHILNDTKKYAQHCKRLRLEVGYDLNHKFSFDFEDIDAEKKLQEEYEMTRNLYFKEFGVSLKATRSRFLGPVYHIRKVVLGLFQNRN